MPRAADVVAHIEHARERLRRGPCRHRHRRRRSPRSTTWPAYQAPAPRSPSAAPGRHRRAGRAADTFPFVDDLSGPDQFRKLARLLAGAAIARRGSRRSSAPTSWLRPRGLGQRNQPSRLPAPNPKRSQTSDTNSSGLRLRACRLPSRSGCSEGPPWGRKRPRLCRGKTLRCWERRSASQEHGMPNA